MPSPADLERAAARRVEVLKIIETSISERGYPPTVSELAASTEVSTLATRRDLDTLVAQGKIERDPGVARGLRLVY